jgi:outer membrane protein OmpA-like peptidoglycan-associated protein
MKTRNAKPTRFSPVAFAPVVIDLLQRKCACGTHTVGGNQCNDCGEKRQTLQRRPARVAERTGATEEVPSIVHETLRSSGQPLDAATRSFMEPRFGHDFSRVRVHTDARASESARAVNALAYTVGPHIVFASGQYAPLASTGRQLMAHELAHVKQQSSAHASATQLRVGEPSDDSERAADQTAQQVLHGEALHATSAPSRAAHVAPVLRRQLALGGDDPVLEVGTTSPLAASFAGSLSLDAFGFNQSELTESHVKSLEEHAKRILNLLKHYPNSFITITGHADAVGSEESNQELGQKRADAVLSELAKNGVPSEIMRASSLGETLPEVKTKKAEPRNRRVEIFFRARSYKFGGLLGKLEPPPSLLLQEPTLGKTGGKKIDLTVKSLPTSPRPFDPSLGMHPKQPETSVSGIVFGKVDELINPLIKGLPKWMQDKIRDGAHSAIEKGGTWVLDQALNETSLGDEGKEAVRGVVGGLLNIKFKF